MTTSKAEVIISAQDRASEVLRRLGSTVDRAQSSFERINAPLLRFQTLWASLIGGAVVAGFRSLVSAIDDLDEAAQGLGTTAVELSNLRIAAGEAGIGAESFDTALTRLNVNISEAAAGSKQQAALFKALGISIKDAAGNVRPTTEVMRELADRFAQLEDGPAKAALAVDLFGKAGARLLPLLNQGAAGLDKFSGLTEDTVRSAIKLQGELDKLNVEWERMKFAVAGGVVPAINDVIDVIKQVDFSKVGAEFNTFFLGNFGAAIKEYARQVEVIGARQKQLREALKLGEGAYSNEGRAALQSAQAIRDKAKADAEATTATTRKAKATQESSNAYAKEFADLERIRRNRERTRSEIEGEEEAAITRRQQRLADLTGQSGVKQQTDDLKTLEDAFFAGLISVEEFDVGLQKVFGTNSDVEKGMERQADLAGQLGLQMASSLGELITAGGKAGDVWKALGQDVLKLITQMLILKPLADELGRVFKDLGFGGAGGTSGGGAGLFGGLFKGIVGALGSGGGTGQNANGSWGIVDASSGRAGALVVNNYIDGAIDRARISSYVESGVRAGIAQSWDNVARGGSGVFAG